MGLQTSHGGEAGGPMMSARVLALSERTQPWGEQQRLPWGSLVGKPLEPCPCFLCVRSKRETPQGRTLLASHAGSDRQVFEQSLWRGGAPAFSRRPTPHAPWKPAVKLCARTPGLTPHPLRWQRFMMQRAFLGQRPKVTPACRWSRNRCRIAALRRRRETKRSLWESVAGAPEWPELVPQSSRFRLRAFASRVWRRSVRQQQTVWQQKGSKGVWLWEIYPLPESRNLEGAIGSMAVSSSCWTGDHGLGDPRPLQISGNRSIRRAIRAGRTQRRADQGIRSARSTDKQTNVKQWWVWGFR